MVRILAISLLAVSLACSAEIACSGLFLLNRDSVTIGRHTFFGGVDYERLGGRWKDGWDLDVRWNTANFMAGFQSDFGLLFMGASLEGIALGSGSVKWTPEDGAESEIPVIDARWESSMLRKGAWLGARLGDHRLRGFLGNVESSPVNRSSEYYIRDSVSLWILGGNYSVDPSSGSPFGGLSVGYTYINADVTLQGIRTQEDSRKRFLYLPLSASAHVVDLGYGVGPVGLRAMALGASAHLDNDGSRFFETLAANRALSSSVMQVLSFSFLQKSFRANADANLMAAAVGASYRKKVAPWVEPVVSLDFFVVDGDIDGLLLEESAWLLGVSYTESPFGWDFFGLGGLLGLGADFRVGAFGFSVMARQVLPLVFDVQEKYGDSPEESDDSMGLGDVWDNLGNGLFLSVSLSFYFS